MVCFFFLYYGGLEPQATSNLIAFSVTVTFSFLVNARFTFRQPASLKRYLLYVPFMGALSWLIGAYADSQSISPIITIILFSLLSLVVGLSTLSTSYSGQNPYDYILGYPGF